MNGWRGGKYIVQGNLQHYMDSHKMRQAGALELCVPTDAEDILNAHIMNLLAAHVETQGTL